MTKPGDEVLTFAPFFPEYIPYVEGTGATLTVVPPDTTAFQIDFEAFERALNPNVAVVLINTPNNPSGAAYSAATLERLAGILRDKQTEYGHDIFLVSDEPYREIMFDGATQAYPAKFYDNTLTCYSFSKSLAAGRAHRLRGGESARDGRGRARAHVRADQPHDWTQLPELHDAARSGARDR